MTDLKTYQQIIVPYLAPKKNLHFEVYYWGSFQFINAENFNSNHNKVAVNESAVGTSYLVFDEKENGYKIPGRFEGIIAQSLEPFLGSPSALAEAMKNDSTIHIDKRQGLTELVPAHQLINTRITDPEHFDDVQNYLNLIKSCQELDPENLFFDAISGTEISEHHKQFIFTRGTQSWTVDLYKELFDKSIFTFLNQFIEHSNFVHTINKKMEMVVLKLEPNKFEELERMGLLI